MNRPRVSTSERALITRQLCQGRSVLSWKDFPEATAKRYQAIAALFPDHVIRACDSRVDGYYVDAADPAERRALRARLGKGNYVSDYDFVVDARAVPTGPLPSWADRLRPHVSHGRTIEVPRP